MTAVRRCEGPAPPDADPVAHLGIPPALWQPVCPFRVLREPAVTRWLVRYVRWRRYGTLPDPGGLDDQEERVLQAFDVMTAALALPRAETGRPA